LEDAYFNKGGFILKPKFQQFIQRSKIPVPSYKIVELDEIIFTEINIEKGEPFQNIKNKFRCFRPTQFLFTLLIVKK